MQIDISEIVSCENREVTEKVHIEQDTFVSRLGEFPITASAPFDLRIANREGSELLLSGETDLTVSTRAADVLRKFRRTSTLSSTRSSAWTERKLWMMKWKKQTT